MDQFEFNTQPSQHYTTAAPYSEVNRDNRPNTPDQYSPFSLYDGPAKVYYRNEGQGSNETPLSSPIPSLLVGILIICIYKAKKNKIMKLLAYFKKK